MNKILIIALLMAIGFTSNAQTFGGIRGKNNGGTQGDVKRDADALKVSDSTLKVRLDSMLVYQRADSLALSNVEGYLGSLYGIEGTVNLYYYEDIISKNSSKWIGGSATSTTTNNLWTNSNIVTKMEIPAMAVGYVSHYKTINVFIRASGTISSGGNIKLQGSTDSSTWDAVVLWDADSLKSDGLAFNLVAPIEKHWSVPVQYPYYRLQTPTITGGGTIQGWALLSQSSFAPSVVGVDSNQFRNTMKVSQLPSIALAANSGVDIGDVTINNASGASAVNIQDGGNSITVDGTVGVSGTVTVGSHAVTNAGTFAVQVDSSTQRNTMKVLNTVATSLDSSTQRSTIKISSMPSVSVDSTTGSRITQKISELVPLVAGTAYIGKTRLTDGTTDAEVVPLAGYNAGAVAIVDGSGNHITSFGGGTQYAEGNTTDPATGTAALMRYDDTDLALTDEQMSMPLLTSRGEQRTLQTNGAVVTDNITSNGDYVTIPCDGYNSIIVTTSGTFNLTWAVQWSTDGSTYTSNSNNYTIFSITTTSTRSINIAGSTAGIYSINTYGAKSVRIIATAYTSGTMTVTAAPTMNQTSLEVSNGSQSTPLYVNLASLSNSTGYYWTTEDGASSNGGGLVKTGLVRQDAPTSSASADADYIDAKATKFGSMLVKNEERHFRTYTAAFTVAPAASCTDLFEIVAGSKTVKINKITITGTQTTGSTYSFYVIKRSTANTGGTFSAATFVPHLTGDAAASSVGNIYTANPTLGTAVGSVGVKYLYVGTSTERADELVFDFGEKGKPIYLTASTSQALALNLNSRTFSGGSFAVTIEITEED